MGDGLKTLHMPDSEASWVLFGLGRREGLVCPEHHQSAYECPDPGFYWGCLGHLIVHLNDDCEWDRERIADWLDTQEG